MPLTPIPALPAHLEAKVSSIDKAERHWSSYESYGPGKTIRIRITRGSGPNETDVAIYLVPRPDGYITGRDHAALHAQELLAQHCQERGRGDPLPERDLPLRLRGHFPGNPT